MFWGCYRGCCLKDIHLGFDTVWGQLTHFRGMWWLIQDEDCPAFSWRLMWFGVCNETFKRRCLVGSKLLQCVPESYSVILKMESECSSEMSVWSVPALYQNPEYCHSKKLPLSPKSVMSSSFYHQYCQTLSSIQIFPN